MIHVISDSLFAGLFFHNDGVPCQQNFSTHTQKLTSDVINLFMAADISD